MWELRVPLSARRLLRLNHALAILLLAVDCVARAWRIQLASWAAGGRLEFRDALRLNLYGEAASTFTPNRLGGEPARFLGMTWSGLRVVQALVALGVEVAAEWPVFGVVAGAGAAVFVPPLGGRGRPVFPPHPARGPVRIAALAPGG